MTCKWFGFSGDETAEGFADLSDATVVSAPFAIIYPEGYGANGYGEYRYSTRVVFERCLETSVVASLTNTGTAIGVGTFSIPVTVTTNLQGEAFNAGQAFTSVSLAGTASGAKTAQNPAETTVTVASTASGVYYKDGTASTQVTATLTSTGRKIAANPSEETVTVTQSVQTRSQRASTAQTTVTVTQSVSTRLFIAGEAEPLAVTVAMPDAEGFKRALASPVWEVMIGIDLDSGTPFWAPDWRSVYIEPVDTVLSVPDPGSRIVKIPPRDTTASVSPTATALYIEEAT